MKLLLLVADSVRADAVGGGTAGGTTGGTAGGPADLAAFGGARFTDVTCSGSWTIPSLAAMVTGELPHRVGVANWYHRAWERDPTSPIHTALFPRLAAAGFAVDVLVPNPTHAFAGWPGVTSIGDSLDDAVIVETLRRPGPRLVVLHHWWTHLPYLPRPADRRLTWSGLHEASEVALTALVRDPAGMGTRLRRMYAAAVQRLLRDDLPRWLDAFGDGWVLATADHGESWGELAPGGRVRHIFDLHGRWLEDETTRVPLQLFSTRGSLPARSVATPARGVDVGPTLAALAGLPWEQRAPESGRSLLDAAHGATLPPAPVITVGSANCETPDRYPERGAELWRYWSERTPAGRVTAEAGAAPSTLTTLPPNLAALHAEAVDSGPMPAEWEARRDAGEARHAAVFGKLRRLGYSE